MKKTPTILSSPPPITPIREIRLPDVQQKNVSHDIPLFVISKPGSEVIKLEFVFIAGRLQEHKHLVASTCASLLREGAGKWSSKQMANYVGYYGASLEVSADVDSTTIQLVCLKKYLFKFIKPLEYILQAPQFSDKELHAFIHRRCQKLKVELKKNDVVAYRILTECLYGPNHPYGYNSTEQKYQNVTSEDLMKHFNDYIHAESCMIFAAGDINQNDESIIFEMASRVRPPGPIQIQKTWPLEPSRNKEIHLPGSPNQCSIKIGRRLFTRRHLDYPGMSFLNTLLGGYFGSRLVYSLREEKGLTYGVYSSIDHLLEDGYFMVSTEVDKTSVKESLQAIYHECERLQNELVSQGELAHVKNYMMGMIMNLFDGPFNSMRAIKLLALPRIPISEINALIHKSQTITPQEIMSLARKYLDRNDFWEVVVGD